MAWIKVTRERYLKFVKNYPKPLRFDCTNICEPPVGSYNDFSDGKVWPESIVAKEIQDWLGPNGERDTSNPGKFWKYLIDEGTRGD